ncbi:hypothetical protein GJ744_008345 [Endocarpon pusillum]|uniref:AMP-dependent synthetase/ligase domain-containing protein n=1 Tax=Endocarpon pusillum TaxID=364733 RepID=A0A8H7AHB1_9EURO|nr:hypothetical protein GJ744_008345 [Endocarpon pusillum]
MSTQSTPRKLWEHPNPETTQMHQFKNYLSTQTNTAFPDFQTLYSYSVTQPATFYHHLFNYFPLIYTDTLPNATSDRANHIFDPGARMDSIPPWFPGMQLNFAENILFTGSLHGQRCKTNKEDDKTACVSVREGSFTEPIQHLTWSGLRQRVALLANAMRAHGLEKGDRVAVVASNSIDTLTVFLATTSRGGLFSSTSTDMGVTGILDRLTQIRPRWVFVDDFSVYNGRTVDLRPKMAEIVAGMEGVPEFEGLVAQPRFSDRPAEVSNVPSTVSWDEFLRKGSGDGELTFERVDFSDPFLIVYSSGTTGSPKCLVHCVGGVVLNGFKEGMLHRCFGAGSVALQYTTTGWIMYLAAVQALLFGSTMVLYDGNPFLPNLETFIHLTSHLGVTHLGISPRYLQELQKNSIIPRQVADLSALQVVTSTGMVLSDQLFEWFYDVAFPKHVQLENISGGTDIAGAFATGNPLLPVYVGGCQGPSLGTPIAVFDQTVEGGRGVEGRPVEDGVPGELVATGPFPNMPRFFWGDEDGKRYRESYFAKFDDCWVHGDFVMIHPTTKQIIFLGRSDGVLNPSGVRFGSGEIYAVVDARFGEVVADSICVGQKRPSDTDESVMLFVLMKSGRKFTPGLVNDIKAAIRKELSPRHVPRYIFETPEIPTTVNLKKVELPVKQIVSGKMVKPSGTLLNPASLDYYYQFAKVEELTGQLKAKL